MLKLAVSNTEVPDDPFAGLDYMLPEARERVFAAAGIEYAAGDSLDQYLKAKCALGELRRRARLVQEVMDLTESESEVEALAKLRLWVRNQKAGDPEQ